MISFVVSNTGVLIIDQWALFIIILYQFLHSKNKGNSNNLCGQRGGWRRQWENVVSARTPLSSLPPNHICTIWREHRTPEPPQPNAMMMQKPTRRGYTAPQGRVVRNCWKPICPIFNIIRFPFSSYPGSVILIWWFFELCDPKVTGFVWFMEELALTTYPVGSTYMGAAPCAGLLVGLIADRVCWSYLSCWSYRACWSYRGMSAVSTIVPGIILCSSGSSSGKHEHEH